MKINQWKQKCLLITVVSIFTAASSSYAHNDKYHYTGAMKSIPHSLVQFDTGSALLSDEAKTGLRTLVSESRAKGRIADVAVAAWSDKTFPRNGEALPQADRDLATSRLGEISYFLKNECDVTGVATYNMAESSNWLAKIFNTSDSELKSVFSKKGAVAPVTKAEFQIIKNEGGPNSAVIVVERPTK